MRRQAPRPLALALESEARRVKPATLLARVQACWAEAAGAVVAEEAEAVSERAGTITFACRSSVWAQELSLMSEELLERLNEALSQAGGAPALGGLRFVTGGSRRPR